MNGVFDPGTVKEWVLPSGTSVVLQTKASP
jgi:hypothetical protein